MIPSNKPIIPLSPLHNAQPTSKFDLKTALILNRLPKNADSETGNIKNKVTTITSQRSPTQKTEKELLKKELDSVSETLISEITANKALSKSEKTRYIREITDRFLEHKASLDDFGFDFQQLYFAMNLGEDLEKISSTEEIAHLKLLDNSVPDRAMVTYLEQLTKFKNSDEWSKCSVEEKAQIEVSLVKIKEALKVSVMVTLTISSTGSAQKLSKKALTSYLTNKIENLKAGEELTIPSGFMRGGTTDILNAFKLGADGYTKTLGHAIFVNCKKENNQSLTFSIFNTGMGSDVHHRIEGKIAPLVYNTKDLKDHNSIEQFFTKLVNCSNLPLSQDNPVNEFYSCFKGLGFTKVRDRNDPTYTAQSISNCTQFSVRAFLKGQMSEELFDRFDDFVIDDGIKKCNNFINRSDAKEIERKIFYKHPSLKPKNKLHFLLIWIIAKLITKKDTRFISGNLAFEMEESKLQGFVKKIEKAKIGKIQKRELAKRHRLVLPPLKEDRQHLVQLSHKAARDQLNKLFIHKNY